MSRKNSREPAVQPNDLERLLIDRQWEGDVEGMVVLYEPNAVLDDGEGQLAIGQDEIRTVFAKFNTKGTKFARGKQSSAVVSGGLALTSTHLPDGNITTEV